MKYLILINGNPQSRAVWESFTDEQRAEGYELYARAARAAPRIRRAGRRRSAHRSVARRPHPRP